MANTWLRLYHDLLKDEKIISLAFEDQRHYIGVLILKSEGTLDKAIDENLLDRIVAQTLWIDHAIIRDVKKRLVDVGLISEKWQPIAWDKRQVQSDGNISNAERQKRYRDRKKLQDNDSNVTRNVTSNGAEKKREEKNREDNTPDTPKIFSFTLNRNTSVENLSREYLLNLKEHIENSTYSLTYEDFINGLESKGTKYKNFKSAYNTWGKNKAKWDLERGVKQPKKLGGMSWA